MIERKCHKLTDGQWHQVDCPPFARPAPGLGDAVAAMAKAAGLKETAGCGCARRRATLNRWTPAWLSQLLGRLGRVGSRPAR